MTSVQDKLKSIQSALKMSLEDIARKVGTSKNTVLAWKQGDSVPTRHAYKENLEKLWQDAEAAAQGKPANRGARRREELVGAIQMLDEDGLDAIYDDVMKRLAIQLAKRYGVSAPTEQPTPTKADGQPFRTGHVD